MELVDLLLYIHGPSANVKRSAEEYSDMVTRILRWLSWQYIR